MYNILAMPRASTDSSYLSIYSDVGGTLFEDTELATSFENVKMTLEDWVCKINEKRDARRESGAAAVVPL